MESSIEQFDRQRIKLLKWLLVVYGLWHGMIILYALVGGTIAISFSRLEPLRAFVAQITKYYLAAGLIAFLVFLIFLLKWWLYKRALRKQPAIATAVNDELVKQSWLRAFRQSFIVMIALLVAFEVLKIVTNTALFW
ncbi:MAG: hypothetical protein J7L26_04065, partial [Candidatus Aminicenantes bacterium]|nr:hypothetical protein [Candidatus Aminicenantes bacterium]